MSRVLRQSSYCVYVFYVCKYFNLPDEVPAVGTVSGLSQVRGHELVAVHLVDPATDSTLTFPGTHPLPKHALFILSAACPSWKHKIYQFCELKKRKTRFKMYLKFSWASKAAITRSRH